MDPDVWVENVNLFGGIVKAAEELFQIQQRLPEELTLEEIEKLQAFNMLKRQDISPKDKLEALLALTIEKDQRDIYRDRYKVNSELLEQREDKKEEVEELFAPITKEDIVGGAIFSPTRPALDPRLLQDIQAYLDQNLVTTDRTNISQSQNLDNKDEDTR